MRIRRGSRPFRKILCDSTLTNHNPANLRTVLYYAELAQAELPALTQLKSCLGLWNQSYLTNDFRNFLFLLRNNSLPLNNRLHAMDPDTPPTCNFCRIIDRDTAYRENFYHLFYRCPVTCRLLRQWANCLEPVPDIDTPEFCNFYWYGNTDNDNDPPILVLVPDLFKYCLWKFKLRRKIPSFPAILSEFKFLLGTFCAASKKLRTGLGQINMIADFLQARG